MPSTMGPWSSALDSLVLDLAEPAVLPLPATVKVDSAVPVAVRLDVGHRDAEPIRQTALLEPLMLDLADTPLPVRNPEPAAPLRAVAAAAPSHPARVETAPAASPAVAAQLPDTGASRPAPAAPGRAEWARAAASRPPAEVMELPARATLSAVPATIMSNHPAGAVSPVNFLTASATVPPGPELPPPEPRRALAEPASQLPAARAEPVVPSASRRTEDPRAAPAGLTPSLPERVETAPERPAAASADPPPAAPVTASTPEPPTLVTLLPHAASVHVTTPDNGALAVRLQVREGLTHVQMHGAAAPQLESRAPELRQALESAGLSLGGFGASSHGNGSGTPDAFGERGAPPEPGDAPPVRATGRPSRDGARLHVKA